MDLSNVSINVHSSIRIAGDLILYFDPFQISQESHDADIIFITHEHYDHFQPESIAKVKKESTLIIAPASMEKKIKEKSGISNIKCLELGEECEVNALQIKAVPAYNGMMKPFHTKGKKWIGYLVEMSGVKYYVAGDTDVNADIKNVACDVALIPIGGMYTMDKKQAADYILGLKPKAVIPTHYGELVGQPSDGSDFKKIVEKADAGIQVEIRI